MFIAPGLQLIEGKNNKIGMLGISENRKVEDGPNSFLERVMNTTDRKNDIIQWLDNDEINKQRIFLCNNPDGTSSYLTQDGTISKK